MARQKSEDTAVFGFKTSCPPEFLHLEKLFSTDFHHQTFFISTLMKPDTMDFDV